MKKILITLTLLALVVSSCKEKSEKLDTLTETNVLESSADNEKATTNENQFNTTALTQQFSKLDGSTISFQEILDNNKGKNILIDVWASWCPDCIKAIPSIQTIKTNFPEVAFINLSLDKTTEAWKEGIEKYNISGEHYFLGDDKRMKSDFGQAIELNWIPRYIVVNKQGEIALFNATEKNLTEIADLLNNLK